MLSLVFDITVISFVRFNEKSVNTFILSKVETEIILNTFRYHLES